MSTPAGGQSAPPIPAWSRTGLMIFIADDSARPASSTVSPKDSAPLVNAPHQLIIKLRAGWQSYDHADIQAFGYPAARSDHTVTPMGTNVTEATPASSPGSSRSHRRPPPVLTEPEAIALIKSLLAQGRERGS
jgi:hypothetical protein